jgi:hypothetical protein
MPFTSPELVRAHLSDLRLGEMAIAGAALTLSGTQPVALPHGGLTPQSTVVKADLSAGPTRESHTLASDWVTVSHAQLVPGSVLVASDGSLSAVYVENVDYIVDYGAGRVRRVPAGAITNGQTVEIWYRYYHIYAAGDDYIVDSVAGTLARKSSGTIADGQIVLLDYRVPLGTISESVIERAIAEAAEAVLAMIDSRYCDEPANSIIIGETHWAVAVVCRIRAAASLAETGGTSASSQAAAQIWLELAACYQQTGRDHLARFAAPVPPLLSAKRT